MLEAENGEDALALLEGTIPHLIILDVHMPTMNGFEFLKRLKKKPETENIPVIIVTSDEKIETRTEVFRLRANDFVKKPLEQNDFIPRVRRYIF